MSNRFATRIGLPSAEERPPDAFDLVAFHEPAVGASARTKGSLYLLAQLTGGSASLAKATRVALDAIQRDYYYWYHWAVRLPAPTDVSTTAVSGSGSRAAPA